jgi:hypothetical protein
MNCKSVTPLNWMPSQLLYRCRFGELEIFKLKFNGLKSNPNIFEVVKQATSPPAAKRPIVAHAYSLPCLEDQRKGIRITNNFIHHVYSVYKHYYVDTSGCFDHYMARYKGKALNTLKRKTNKIVKSNKSTDSFREFSSVDEVDEFLLIAKSISKTSYQEKLLGRFLPASLEFEDKMRNLANQGLFRGFILYAEDKPIAYNLCPIYGNGVMLYDFTGYNPGYAKYSPGTVLQLKIIETCFLDPRIFVYDLCSGEGRHKEFFATDYKACCDVYYFPLSFINLSIVYIKSYIEGLSSLITSLLISFGIKDKIKTFMRRFRLQYDL